MNDFFLKKMAAHHLPLVKAGGPILLVLISFQQIQKLLVLSG
jgi:hypothetical protein